MIMMIERTDFRDPTESLGFFAQRCSGRGVLVVGRGLRLETRRELK